MPKTSSLRPSLSAPLLSGQRLRQGALIYKQSRAAPNGGTGADVQRAATPGVLPSEGRAPAPEDQLRPQTTESELTPTSDVTRRDSINLRSKWQGAYSSVNTKRCSISQDQLGERRIEARQMHLERKRVADECWRAGRNSECLEHLNDCVKLNLPNDLLHRYRARAFLKEKQKSFTKQ